MSGSLPVPSSEFMDQPTGSGLLIVVEGIDGAGKGTQAALLCDRLRDAGESAALLNFPRYQHTFFGQRVADFLNGRFGELDEVAPFLASLLYAGDRFESRSTLCAALRDHSVVVLDRYVSSNIAHQGAKLPPEQRSELRSWIEHLEFEIYQLPRPDRVILLDATSAASQQLVARKAARDYTQRTHDLQEADAPYLARVRDAYLSLAMSESNWRVVAVGDANAVRSIDAVAADVWTLVDELRRERRP